MSIVRFLALVNILILLLVSFILIKSNRVSGGYQSLQPSMLNDAQLWGRAWTSPVEFNGTNSNVACDDLVSAEKVSNCQVTLNPRNRNHMYPEEDQKKYRNVVESFPTASPRVVTLAVKLKAWALAQDSYCQIAVKIGPSFEALNSSDYANHTEVFGDENFKLSGRRISYMVIPVPLSSSGEFSLQVFRENMGNCETSVSVTTLGAYF